jgi:hypothetical protein
VHLPKSAIPVLPAAMPAPMDGDTKRTSHAEILGGTVGGETKRTSLAEILATLPVVPSPPLGDTSPSVPSGVEDPMDIAIHVDDESEAADTDADRHIGPLGHFRLAEAALERGELGTAERMARLAMEAEPGKHDYLALYAWVRALTGSTPVTNESLGLLSGIVEREPSHERALLYRGRLYKRTGRAGEAKKDFEALVRAHPGHREGAAELRLLRGLK